MAILYKGAGPGTHWWQNNPQQHGGFRSAPSARGMSPGAAVLHVTAYSHPSPFVSLTASFAVAREYALSGPAGVATRARPGFVYVVDTARASVRLRDPIRLIAGAQPSLATVTTCLATHHDGGSDLILGVASPRLHGPVLTTPPRRIRGGRNAPQVTQEFQALVFALRDAEVLAQSVAPACIVNQVPVW